MGTLLIKGFIYIKQYIEKLKVHKSKTYFISILSFYFVTLLHNKSIRFSHRMFAKPPDPKADF